MFVFSKVIPETLLVPFFSGHGVLNGWGGRWNYLSMACLLSNVPKVTGIGQILLKLSLMVGWYIVFWGRWNCKYWKMQVWKSEVQSGKMCNGRKYKYGKFKYGCARMENASTEKSSMKTWNHPQNRKYTTYCSTTRGGTHHGHREHAQKIRQPSQLSPSDGEAKTGELWNLWWACCKSFPFAFEGFVVVISTCSDGSMQTVSGSLTLDFIICWLFKNCTSLKKMVTAICHFLI